MGFTEISRERAKKLVEECDKGIIITGDVSEVPVIGELDDDEDREYELVTQKFQFGKDNIDVDWTR